MQPELRGLLCADKLGRSYARECLRDCQGGSSITCAGVCGGSDYSCSPPDGYMRSFEQANSPQDAGDAVDSGKLGPPEKSIQCPAVTTGTVTITCQHICLG